MKIILRTERLYLREFMVSDGFHFFHLNNDNEVIKHTGNSPFDSLKEATDFVKNYNDYERNGFGRWAVCLKESDEFIGWCGLKYDDSINEVDLGFRFYKKQWSKGYATEAALGCIAYGFSKLRINKIVGRTYIENKASVAVLKKCNFKFKKHFLYDNQPAVFYTITND